MVHDERRQEEGSHSSDSQSEPVREYVPGYESQTRHTKRSDSLSWQTLDDLFSWLSGKLQFQPMIWQQSPCARRFASVGSANYGFDRNGSTRAR